MDGRLTMAELGRRVRLSPPAVAERVQRLERTGVITGYQAVVDPKAIGYPSAEDAEAANKAAASWVAENLADEVELKETLFGEILLATALGVSAKAGARA